MSGSMKRDEAWFAEYNAKRARWAGGRQCALVDASWCLTKPECRAHGCVYRAGPTGARVDTESTSGGVESRHAATFGASVRGERLPPIAHPLAGVASGPLTPSMSRGAGTGKPVGVLPALSGEARVALTLSLVLPWPPTANTNVRHGRHGHYLTPEHRRFRSNVATICRQVRAPLVPSPYRMTVVWYPPDRRARDSDNVLKPLRDALQHAGVIANDRLADCAAYSETAVMPSRPCDGAVHVRIEAA